ncbi:hypothetical protein BU24DRAFT_236208 [Aaosphaeria arxii CBS 175.79]|uniref:Uncharacterized protein n=1 Tax=Aaosphaeria arxii CBS 175.79 TaxID=1450172 RepID=A0A6A5XKH0_9PLEO|nr:uncharacterized protein BU24DRAFT_236208 [Aaosphaeria arxii CBS 175.79]KAF2013379.1 hypothetical protein BU24DRAFT_236208 [Aaosphaeria arxii CBS 175.79]
MHACIPPPVKRIYTQHSTQYLTLPPSSHQPTNQPTKSNPTPKNKRKDTTFFHTHLLLI